MALIAGGRFGDAVPDRPDHRGRRARHPPRRLLLRGQHLRCPFPAPVTSCTPPFSSPPFPSPPRSSSSLSSPPLSSSLLLSLFLSPPLPFRLSVLSSARSLLLHVLFNADPSTSACVPIRNERGRQQIKVSAASTSRSSGSAAAPAAESACATSVSAGLRERSAA